MFQQFNDAFTKLLEKLSGWLDAVIIALPNIILAVLVMSVAIWTSRRLKKFLNRQIGHFSKNKGINHLIANIGSIFIVLAAFFVALGVLNLDKALTSLLAGAGVMGLAVGLALQEPLMNTFSGIMMSMRGNFYRYGDWVHTNGYTGQIKKVNLRWTELEKPSGEKVILPNKMIISNALENYSMTGRRRIEIVCGVGYESDLEEVEKITKTALIEKFQHISSEDDIDFLYTAFGGSSIDFVTRFWIDSIALKDVQIAKSQAIVTIKKAFDKHSVNIPYPVQTVDFSMMPPNVSVQKAYTKNAPNSN